MATKFDFNELIRIVSSSCFRAMLETDVISSLMNLSHDELNVLGEIIDSNLTLDYYDILTERKARTVKAIIAKKVSTTHSAQNGGVSEALKLLECIQVSGLDNIMKLAKAVEILKNI